jgi:4-alpha-glucanotransferase
LRVRAALGIPAGETSDERGRAIAALTSSLRRHGFAHCDFPSVAGYLASSAARVLAIALEDVLEVRDQANVPGTLDQHPNWRRKLPLDLERLGDHPRLREIAHIVAECGRAAHLRPVSAQ